jgi:hypothetical protein
MKAIFGILVIAVAGAALFLFLLPKSVQIGSVSDLTAGSSSANVVVHLPSLPETPVPTSSAPSATGTGNGSADISPQQPLPDPPTIVKGIYLTGWSAGYTPKINAIIGLTKRTEINAVVIDVKDFSGFVSYKTGIPEVAVNGAESQIRINQPNALIKKLHDAGIYVIGRITVFQDPLLAKAHPEWALKNKTTGKVWADNKGLAWMDAAAEPVWEYNAAIAKDALLRGFDEINFDYVRFASDGDLSKISYPFWQKTQTDADLTQTNAETKRGVIRSFFKYLRDNLGDAKLSVDLFGLAIINTDDLGIGQVIEDAYKYFDYVSPMVYPSHYAAGFIGYQNPAKYPYEVIKYSLDRGLARLIVERKAQSATSTTSSTTISDSQFAISSKLRPWLQDFDLGATYDVSMVKKEIQAVYDAFLNPKDSSDGSSSSTSYLLPPTSPLFGGWLLWDPANIYTEGALSPK